MSTSNRIIKLKITLRVRSFTSFGNLETRLMLKNIGIAQYEIWFPPGITAARTILDPINIEVGAVFNDIQHLIK